MITVDVTPYTPLYRSTHGKLPPASSIKTSFFLDPEPRRKDCFAVSLFAKSFAAPFKNAKDSHEIWWKKAMLRDYINATITFEGLATELGKPSKSVHCMLGPKGNPRAENILEIIRLLPAAAAQCIDQLPSCSLR
jgi:hypothetical protein